MKNYMKSKIILSIVFLIFFIFIPVNVFGQEDTLKQEDLNQNINLNKDKALDNTELNFNNINEANKKVEEDLKQINGLYEYIIKLKSDYEILRDVNAKEFVDNFIKNGDGKLEKSIIKKNIKKVLFKETSSTLKLMGILIIISIVCSLLKNLEEAFSNNSISSIAYFACYSTMIIVIAKSFYIGIDLAKNCINGITDFMYALIPVLMTLLASVGAVSQAAFLDPIIIATINIGITIISKIIIPLIVMSFVLNFVNNISDDYKVSNLSKLIKDTVIWTQGILMTIFVAFLSIRSITTKTLDEVTAKTAKFAVDTIIPVVGKSLSDAISTVAGYSLLLKNAVGTLGLVIIILILLSPIIKLFVMAAIYKLTGALIQPVSDKKLVQCINSAGDSLILIMSSVICISVMCFIMVAIITATGGNIITV